MEKKAGKSSFAKLHHVGVVVKDIRKAIAYFESLGIGPFTAPDVKPGRPPVFTIPFNGALPGRAGAGIWSKGRAGLGFIYSDPTPVGGLAVEFRERVPPPPKTAKK